MILRTLRLTPKTEMMAKTGFCHAGLWSANLLRKGEKILAIDFETANVAPAFVDLGSLLFNWGNHFRQRKPSYLDRRRREVVRQVEETRRRVREAQHLARVWAGPLIKRGHFFRD